MAQLSNTQDYSKKYHDAAKSALDKVASFTTYMGDMMTLLPDQYHGVKPQAICLLISPLTGYNVKQFVSSELATDGKVKALVEALINALRALQSASHIASSACAEAGEPIQLQQPRQPRKVSAHHALQQQVAKFCKNELKPKLIAASSAAKTLTDKAIPPLMSYTLLC